jgi:hypothetical protein
MDETSYVLGKSIVSEGRRSDREAFDFIVPLVCRLLKAPRQHFGHQPTHVRRSIRQV